MLFMYVTLIHIEWKQSESDINSLKIHLHCEKENVCQSYKGLCIYTYNH